jgi:hypothetical protein
MKYGRLIRVSSGRGDPNAVVYVVAEYDPARAIEVIRAHHAATAGLQIKDLGRVTDVLLSALNLKEGEFART